jgi:hypothetical protein
MKKLIRSSLLILSLVLAAGSTDSQAKNCKKGKACGDACIAAGETCRAKQGAKVCKKGKACGNACIAMNKVCHATPS